MSSGWFYFRVAHARPANGRVKIPAAAARCPECYGTGDEHGWAHWPSCSRLPCEQRVVRWVDSSLQNVQVDKDDFPKPVTITSLGFVVEETEEYVVLARDDMGHDGDYRGLVAIPKIAVLDDDMTGARAGGVTNPDRWSLVAQARVVQSELAWLGGFLETAMRERPDLPKRTDKAYRTIQLLIEEITCDICEKPLDECKGGPFPPEGAA